MKRDYKGLQKELIDKNIQYASYCSDLYILDNPENIKILNKYGWMKDGKSTVSSERFITTDGIWMIDIPFMYEKDLFDIKNRTL